MTHKFLFSFALVAILAGCGKSDPTAGVPSVTSPTTSAPTTAITTATGPVAVTRNSSISIDGIGAIKVGMSLDEVKTATGQQLTETVTPLAEGGVCSIGELPGVDGVSFTLYNHRIAVVSTENPTNTTPSGLHVGSTVAQVRSALTVRETAIGLHYEPTGQDGRTMLFGLDNSNWTEGTSHQGSLAVQRVSAGKSNIDYYNGCD